MNKKILVAAIAAIGLSGCNSDKSMDTTPGTVGDFKTNVGDKVHFGFDKSCIAPEAKATLASQAAWLKTYADKKATVIGKCDERGTREYNIALGQRRAENAATILKQEGVANDRVSVVSYGKDRPEMPNAQNDQEHAQNRVAVTDLNA